MKHLFVFFGIILFITGVANADLVAGWDMLGETGDQESTPGISGANISADDMVRGSDLTAATASNAFSSRGWDDDDDGDYIQFGFSVDTSYQVSLEELWIGTRSSGTGPGTIGVYTSLDGYSNPIYSITQNNTDYSNSIIDMESLGTITGDFSVRLYEIGNTQADGEGETAGTGTFRIVDYYDGTYIDTHFEGIISSVPVPGAVWLLGSTLIAMTGIRRRKG